MTDNGAIEKYCYDDNPTHCATYGGLYQWDEMMQYSTDAGNRGICPEGWHIPREIEYNLLKSTTNQDGNALKAVGEGAGTNTSGFSALLSGNRDHTGTFEAITTYTGFWTSDGSGISGFFKSLTENGGMFDEGGNKTNGYSIRCVLDYLGEPDSPNLGFPANHTDNWSTTTDITWSIPHKTEWFSLQIASDELFSNLLFSDNQLNQNSETLAYLDYNTTYYWRVKANNSYGASDWSTPSAFTTVNDNVTFDPCPGVSSVNYGGEDYQTVQIGSQCWLKRNLNIGSTIQESDTPSDNGTIEKYCYGDSQTNCDNYGGLYTWNEAIQYQNAEVVQGICPDGWRIPTWEDFDTLNSYVNDNINSIKAIGQGIHYGTGTDTTGFSALLGGLKTLSGSYGLKDYLGYYWAFDTHHPGTGNGPSIYLSYADSILHKISYSDNGGMSVRCIKDEGSTPSSPTLSSPTDESNGVAVLPTTIIWNSTDSTNSYTIQLSKNSSFSEPLVIDSTLTNTRVYLSNLELSTLYYWRVRSNNFYGSSNWSTVWSFTTGNFDNDIGAPCPGTETVDYGGKTYNTVLIGSQCWFKENLDVGTMISAGVNSADNATIEKYCYDNNESNCNAFGALYQWDEAMQYSRLEGAQGICPDGWHLPTKAEFETLKSNASNSGNALKGLGQGSGGGTGTNSSGFTALLSGHKQGSSFFNLGLWGYFWTSSEDPANPDFFKYRLYLTPTSDITFVTSRNKFDGYNIRCIKD
jgi:uncharacterized protein (TIGR02145 family)